MRTLIAIMLMVLGSTVIAQQANMLDTLRQVYEKQEQSALAQYGKALDTVLEDLKKKGDLDNVLILQSERKRFDAEKTVLAPKDTSDSFRPATEEYYQTMVKLLEQYVAALNGLIKKETAADRIEEAMLVKTERDKTSFLLADMQTKLPVKDVVSKPPPEKPHSTPTTFKPKTYVDETRGWAGMAPIHNVYTFAVENIGRKATFRFWASGDIGIATSGQVLLTGPDVQDQIIHQWQPSDFKIAANTVTSYKTLRPISCNVASYVKQPGEYQFTFRWGGSQVGLAILRVELELE